MNTTTTEAATIAQVLGMHRVNYHHRNVGGDTSATLRYTSCEGCDWLGGHHDEAGWEAHVADEIAHAVGQLQDFTDEDLTMFHRAVRQKLSRLRNDIANDLRKGAREYAKRKTAHRYDYAGLLLKLDTLVPEERR